MIRVIAFFLVTMSIVFATPSLASVVHKDWKSSNDQLVSFEQASGLDWLKLSATTGKTLSYVTSHLSDEFYGWRFPTVAEVRSMAEAQLGAALLMPAFNSGQSVSLSAEQRQKWYTFFGKTDDSTASWGYVEPDQISGIYGVGIFPGVSFHNILYGEAAKNGHAHTYFTGIYLVREAVTVADVTTPAGLAALLMVAGCWSRRKSRR